jgi:cell wall-associated NlpC family hydrolase
MTLDDRVTPLRDGLASVVLEGLVPAQRYVEPQRLRLAVPAAGVRRSPDPWAEQVDQLLFGEQFDALESAQGWTWGQARRDGYVGYVETAALAPLGAAATHRVAAVHAYAFASPDIKAPATGPYSLNALVTAAARDGRFLQAEGGGWFVAEHLAPVGMFDADFVAVAERFLGAAYVWGGREGQGLDCSGLVQQALLACGRACPRDTDHQAQMGRPIAAEALRRGDLVFWPGHVAIALDSGRILHASGHQMAVVIEPLAEAVARIASAGGGEPGGCRRL